MSSIADKFRNKKWYRQGGLIVPLMKKAAAIVTDEGGVTSHAAIVSRELGIPCVIGTQKATNTFKTGQKIKVDADNGIVSVIG